MSEGQFKFTGTLAVVGGGRMGEAIAKGLLSAEAILPEHIVIAEPVAERRKTLEAAHGVGCVATGAEAVRDADVVVIAVKPQVIDDVVAGLAADVGDALVVSIAAGISCARLESLLPSGTPVVRVMPNTPAMVGAGMAVVSGGTEATAEHVGLVRELFALLGKAVVLNERYQDAATAISGSGPAYVALFVDALARAGVAQGLSREIAQQLAIQTVRGTADLLEHTGVHPEELVDGVASPGGTTIAAVEELESGGFRASVAKAVAAAVARAKELGS
ncbi:MAG: pyrroline-5-carboxylate reductase [Coriobacteriia bacterium]|nr:pyrroline-5-carboxylate reductase [Coriobacteriia bacterium]